MDYDVRQKIDVYKLFKTGKSIGEFQFKVNLNWIGSAWELEKRLQGGEWGE